MHKPFCKEHMKRKDNPEYVENCDCNEFVSPCLTYTKIGVALHLEFHDPEGKFNLDVDVSPPTIPVTNVDEYEGSNEKKRAWLLKHRPVDWLIEWWKSPDMSDAGLGGKRSIRLRKINKSLVIPEQVNQSFLSYLNYWHCNDVMS